MALDTSVDLNLFIDNEWRPASTGQTLDIDNPVTREVMGRVTLGDRADAFVTLEAASRAFPAWSHTRGDEHSQLL